MLGLEGCIATIEANMFRTSMFILADVSALLTSYNVQLYRFSLAFVFLLAPCTLALHYCFIGCSKDFRLGYIQVFW